MTGAEWPELGWFAIHPRSSSEDLGSSNGDPAKVIDLGDELDSELLAN